MRAFEYTLIGDRLHPRDQLSLILARGGPMPPLLGEIRLSPETSPAEAARAAARRFDASLSASLPPPEILSARIEKIRRLAPPGKAGYLRIRLYGSDFPVTVMDLLPPDPV